MEISRRPHSARTLQETEQGVCTQPIFTATISRTAQEVAFSKAFPSSPQETSSAEKQEKQQALFTQLIE